MGVSEVAILNTFEFGIDKSCDSGDGGGLAKVEVVEYATEANCVDKR